MRVVPERLANLVLELGDVATVPAVRNARRRKERVAVLTFCSLKRCSCTYPGVWYGSGVIKVDFFALDILDSVKL